MHLALTIHSDHLSVTVSNTASQELRLWELENSWGWFSISFHLKGESDENIYIIKRSSRDWTRDGPSFFVLSPGETREIQLDIKDGWWDIDQAIAQLKDEPISVRASYQVDPTPESDEFDVFVGSVLSDWVFSSPPHSWLFAEN